MFKKPAPDARGLNIKELNGLDRETFWRPEKRTLDKANVLLMLPLPAAHCGSCALSRIHDTTLKPPRLKNMFLPVGIEETVGPDGLAGAGGVDKKIIAHVDADVRVFFPS
jgi:hypothetical protein